MKIGINSTDLLFKHSNIYDKIMNDHKNVKIENEKFTILNRNDGTISITPHSDDAITCINRPTKIISAFPGCGKTFFHKNRKELKTHDSAASNFSWKKDTNGNNTTERNPDFPNNYIRHIINNIGLYDIIFVNSHDVVRKALRNNNIPFVLLYPDKSLKSDFMKRYKNRGSDEKFINFMSDNFDKFVDEIDNDHYATHTIKLKEYNKYLSDNFMLCDDAEVYPINVAMSMVDVDTD